MPLAGCGDGRDLALAARYYELHLLGLVGYQPQLYVLRRLQEASWSRR